MTSHILRRSTAMLGLGTAITMATAFSAHADINAQEVFSALETSVEQSAATITAGSVTLEGDDVILGDVELGNEAGSFTIETIELRDVTESSDGDFTVGEAFIPGTTLETDDGSTVVVGDAYLRDFVLAANGYDDLRNFTYSQATMGPLEVSRDGATVVSIDTFNATIAPFDEGEPIASSATLEGMVVHFDQAGDPRTREVMTALGYETLEADMIANGTWDPETGDLAMNEVTLSARDAADLTFGLSMGGYTQEVIDAMREMQTQMDDDNSQAMGLAMIGLFQQFEIQDLQIRLKDESLTGRILDFVGEQQGMNRDSVAAMAKGMLPFALGQLNAPEFAAQVQSAVSAYLDDPDSFTIKAEPENPVPFAVLMGGAMGGNPASLIETLNLSVSAND